MKSLTLSRCLLRLTLKEIRNSPRINLLLTLNIALGILGFVTLESLSSSVQTALSQRSKEFLGADLNISSRRKLTQSEEEVLSHQLGTSFQETRTIELYSMATGTKRSRLVQIKAIDSGFPLYGSIELQNAKQIEKVPKEEHITENPSVWIYPELQNQLGVKIGGRLQIGQISFLVRDIITQDPANSWKGFSLAPRIYMGKSFLLKTGLIKKGSTITYNRLYKFQGPRHLKNLVKKLQTDLTDPAIHVVSHKTAGQQMARLLGYLTDYLGLVALVALFLGGLGTAYLFHSLLSHRTKEIAILLSLGLTHHQAQRVYLQQLLILGLAASAISFAICWPLVPLLIKLINSLVPFNIIASIHLRTIFVGMGVAVVGSLLMCLPLLDRISFLKPALLFNEESDVSLRKTRISLLIPAACSYFLLAVWQANSFQIASLFILSLAASATILGLGGWFLLNLIENLTSSTHPFLRLAIRNLSRRKLTTISCFLAISLGTLLINLISQIQAGINEDLGTHQEKKVPDLFLFDIQEDQVTELKNLLNENNHRLSYLSPMIRSRLKEVNGKVFSREMRSKRFRNRAFNLTYRLELSDSEELMDGRPFSGIYQLGSQNLPEVSLEWRFAKRLSLKIGDVLNFDVENVPIKAKVVNLRKVRWTSFQPNFFVQFQPGVLNDAPKTFLASISHLKIKEKNHLQSQIVETFQNISILDVSRTVKRILTIVDQMSWALKFMAYLTAVVGLVVLFSITSNQTQHRKREMNLLKTLGVNFSSLRKISLMEFGLLGFTAALSGVLLSWLLSYFGANYLFDGLWVISWPMSIISLLSATLLTLAIPLFALRSLFVQRTPMDQCTHIDVASPTQ